MQPRFANVFVLAPAELVSGGPDCLHRLVSTLNELGARAFMSYLPYSDAHTVPETYRRLYEIPTAPPVDAPDNLIVIPEAMTKRARDFHRARRAIWWLSVDHFIGYAGQGDHVRRRRLILHDVRSLLRARTSRLTWPEMRRVEHYAETSYSQDFLRRRRIASAPLRDPVNDIFLSVAPSGGRRNVVAYNPAKGMHYTQAVLDALAPIPAIELRGYTHEQLINVLREVKVYVDFGYFPGAERMPREALLSGACIVVGRRGAAGNGQDYPIPSAYKIDHTMPDFASDARDAVLRIFDDFETSSADFDPFRESLRAGPTTFVEDVQRLFFRPE